MVSLQRRITAIPSENVDDPHKNWCMPAQADVCHVKCRPFGLPFSRFLDQSFTYLRGPSIQNFTCIAYEGTEVDLQYKVSHVVPFWVYRLSKFKLRGYAIPPTTPKRMTVEPVRTKFIELPHMSYGQWFGKPKGHGC